MSGIYIPNMERPKRCEMCPLYEEIKNGDPDWCKALHKALPEYSDCPLIPVPDHGRLIDADALEKDIDKYIGGEESQSRFHHWVQVQRTVIPESKEART